jgi:hypothetical protein
MPFFVIIPCLFPQSQMMEIGMSNDLGDLVEISWSSNSNHSLFAGEHETDIFIYR